MRGPEAPKVPGSIHTRSVGAAPVPLVRLEAYLFPEVRIDFRAAGDKEDLEAYLSELGSVKRMLLLQKIGAPITDETRQRNDGHVRNLVQDAKQIGTSTIDLPKFIDFSDVQRLNMVHDVGELDHYPNDVSPYNRTKRDVARKRHEPRVAHKILRRIINPRIKEKALELYDRYQVDDPKDLTVQMARYLDKKDGTITYAHVLFNMAELSDPKDATRLDHHLWQTIGQYMKPVINLLMNLPTNAARQEMYELARSDLQKLYDLGNVDVAEAQMLTLDTIMSNFTDPTDHVKSAKIA